jgi:hypothetical protein
MKKSILIIGIGLIFFTSCRKENSTSTTPVTTQESVLDYFPLKDGNYWVYKQSQFDSSGNALPHIYTNDSIVVKNDTLINNMTYHKVVEYNFLGLADPDNDYLRDSANFIVNDKGVIIFSVNPGFVRMQLLSSDTIAYINYSFIAQTTNITVPLGAYSCVDFKGEIFRKIDNYSIAHLSHNYYCKKIGSIKKINLWVTSLERVDLELISYHVN